MRDVPKSIDLAFYAGRRTESLGWAVDDAVTVLSGPRAGDVASVISIERIHPHVELLVEYGTDGESVVVLVEKVERIEP